MDGPKWNMVPLLSNPYKLIPLRSVYIERDFVAFAKEWSK